MVYQKVTAIIPSISLEHIENELEKIGAPGITITKVCGSGGYKNYFSRESLSNYSRIEIFVEKKDAKIISNAIARTVSRGMSIEGIIAIVPVDDFIHIKDFKEVSNDG